MASCTGVPDTTQCLLTQRPQQSVLLRRSVAGGGCTVKKWQRPSIRYQQAYVEISNRCQSTLRSYSAWQLPQTGACTASCRARSSFACRCAAASAAAGEEEGNSLNKAADLTPSEEDDSSSRATADSTSARDIIAFTLPALGIFLTGLVTTVPSIPYAYTAAVATNNDLRCAYVCCFKPR